MKNIKPFKTSVEALYNADFSAFSAFESIGNESVRIFLNGRFYNAAPTDFLTNYLKDGLNYLKKIDGDYVVFIIEENKILIVRDRHGVGSQVFYSAGYITSNLADFTSLDGFNCKPDIDSLFTFLSIGFIPSPQSSLEGVKKLGAGFALVIEKNAQSVIDLYPVEDFLAKANTCKLSMDEATTEYERLHKLAIAQRITGENKVGLLLSGGYDSGGNISALRDIYNGPVTSFSIGFKNNKWTELPLAKILADTYGSTHYDYEIDGTEILELPQIIGQTGDPFQEGGLFVNFTAMKLVKNSNEHPDLILGGDGNDQHFGTSGKELALNWKIKQKKIQFLQHIFDTVGNSSLFEKDNILFRSEFHNRKILHVQQCDVFGFTQSQLSKINLQNRKIKAPAYLKDHPVKFDNFDAFFFNRNVNIDIKQVINNVILFKSSRMAELFGNNMTFPYMSTELYNFLATLPVDFKFHGTLDELSKGKGSSKYLHKKYLKPKLPTEITDRKKQGGFAPLPIFLKDEKQRNSIFAYIKKSDLVKQLFKPAAIENLLNQYSITAGTSGYWFWYQQVKANKIVNLLTLAVWWDMIINKKPTIQSIEELY